MASKYHLFHPLKHVLVYILLLCQSVSSEANEIDEAGEETELEDTRVRRSNFNIYHSKCGHYQIVLFIRSESLINSVSNSDFVDCLHRIGKLPTHALKKWQYDALLNKALKALSRSSVCEMSTFELTQLGVIARAFSVEDINCLPLQEHILVSSLGAVKGWDQQQLPALAREYLKSNSLNDISNFKSTNIILLGTILCGFTASQISTLRPEEVGKSGKAIGNLNECDHNQMKAFARLAVSSQAYGPVNKWSAKDVTELNFLISGLSGSEIQRLKVSAIEGLNEYMIPTIPINVFKHMTRDQLQAFSYEQAKLVTRNQRQVMTTEQIGIIDGILAEFKPILGASEIEEDDTEGESSAPQLGSPFGLFMVVVVVIIGNVAFL